jgi:predicted lactoylglutathione lyase
MRVMVMIKANADTEAGVMPSERLLKEMGDYNEELLKAGIILGGDGLHPSMRGKRVRFGPKGTTVIDGPFAETKELIAGFWMWKVSSFEEAIAWAKRIPNPDGVHSEVELRPVFEAEDFGEEFTPELREQEERQRAEIERRAAPPAPPTQIFVNLPVKDLPRSIAFFEKLGYRFNPQFTDANAGCMIVSDTIYAMLLAEPFFKTFTSKPVADAKKTTEALVALSAPSRAAVDRIVETAVAAGAKVVKDAMDHGFMYQWGFEDLDGHIWEYFWMDPSHVQG